MRGERRRLRSPPRAGPGLFQSLGEEVKEEVPGARSTGTKETPFLSEDPAHKWTSLGGGQDCLLIVGTEGTCMQHEAAEKENLCLDTTFLEGCVFSGFHMDSQIKSHSLTSPVQEKPFPICSSHCILPMQ